MSCELARGSNFGRRLPLVVIRPLVHIASPPVGATAAFCQALNASNDRAAI